MTQNNRLEQILKYILWIGLGVICFLPLYIRSAYYFPYITPKTFLFKVTILVIFLAYLGLAVVNKKYRLKFNLAIIIFAIYILTIIISSILGGSFYFSFWSNNERSEGILLLLHLFLFLIILSGFLGTSPKDNHNINKDNADNVDFGLPSLRNWLILFDLSFLASVLVSLYALGQYLGLKWFAVSPLAGERLMSTLGNAGYVAGYLIFNIFFGLLLFFLRKNTGLRWYYGVSILLHIFIILRTLTRGGIIALAFSLSILVLYLAFFHFKKVKAVKTSAVVILLIGVAFVGLIFLNREAAWVKGNDVFERISSISVDATTAQNRLMTWEAAYKGFKGKPILGYGYENFYQVFDKSFNPKIYRKAGSVVWFDRAHNLVFDRLVTGGIIGFLLYLSLLFAPLYYLWKYFFKIKTRQGYFVMMIFTLLILSYCIQNFFIFEALVTYIPLFMVLGFISQFCPSIKDNFFQSNKPYLASLTVGVVAFFPILFIFSIKPASANKKFVETTYLIHDEKIFEAYDSFIDILDTQTNGNQEYRQHFGEFVVSLTANQKIDYSYKSKVTLRAEQEFDKQIKEKPQSIRNYLMFMRFLNKTYNFNVNRLTKSLELSKKAIELSPTRPMLYYEIAYSQFYLGRYFQSQNQDDAAEELFDEAIVNMQKAIDLNNEVVESYVNIAMILFATHHEDQVQYYLDKMDEIGINRGEDFYKRTASSAVGAKNYHWSSKFYEELIKISPENPDYWVNLALSYAYQKRRDKAIETAQAIQKFGGEYIEQSELFIKDVLSGLYEQQ